MSWAWDLASTKVPDSCPTSIYQVLCIFNASETGLLLVAISKRNVVMMRGGVRIMHQIMRDARIKKITVNNVGK